MKLNYNEVLQYIFIDETGKQKIKQLSEKQLSSVKSASERRQKDLFDTIEQLKWDSVVTVSQRIHPELT